MSALLSNVFGMADLRDKTIVITGGAKNLGGAAARRIAADGAKIVVHYNSDGSADDAADTVAAVEKTGGQAFAFQADLTDAAQVDALFDATSNRFGELFATVNTAAHAMGDVVTAMTEDDVDEMIAINVKGTFLVLQAAARRISDGGRIINLVTSLLSAYTPGYALYAGTKASNEHYIRALSKELAEKQVSVNNIGPGPMDTPFFWDAAHEGEADMVTGMAMGNRLTQVADIVPWIYFLLTDGAWASGQTIFVNGGFSTR